MYHSQYQAYQRVSSWQDKWLYFHAGDTEYVMQMIKNIDLRKSTGCDNIPGKPLRIVYRRMYFLLNDSMTAKSFPFIIKLLTLFLVLRKGAIYDNIDMSMYLLLYLNFVKLFEQPNGGQF